MENEMFKKHMWKTTILLVSILLFTACSNEAKEEAKKEEIKQIQFGKKVNMGEKESIESVFEFFEDVPLPQLNENNPDDIFYRFLKRDIDKADPTYMLELSYDKKDFDFLERSVRMYISNQEDATMFNDLEFVRNKSLLDEKEVEIRKSENDVVMVAFAEGGLHYVLEFHPLDEGYVTSVTKEIIESIEPDAELKERINQELRQSVEDNFTLPSYFAKDVVLYTLSMSKGSIDLHYQKDMKDTEWKILPHFRISHTTTEDHSNWSEEEGGPKFQEIELPSSREAYMTQDSEGPFFYPYDDSKTIGVIEEERHFYVEAYNIEEAEYGADPVHLIKVVDSIED